MSIRLIRHYPRSKLIKVNATSFFSEWFSDSAKAVTRMVSCIRDMLYEDHYRFIFVLMDDIESLAGSRKSAERSEAIRVRFLTLPTRVLAINSPLKCTNALLLGMDRLKGTPNVLFLFTTTMPGALVCLALVARSLC